jgi:uncharacterized protein (DUF1501 family)
MGPRGKRFADALHALRAVLANENPGDRRSVICVTVAVSADALSARYAWTSGMGRALGISGKV